MVCEFHPIFYWKGLNEQLAENSYMYKLKMGFQLIRGGFFFWYLLIYVCNTSIYVCMCVKLYKIGEIWTNFSHECHRRPANNSVLTTPPPHVVLPNVIYFHRELLTIAHWGHQWSFLELVYFVRKLIVLCDLDILVGQKSNGRIWTKHV